MLLLGVLRVWLVAATLMVVACSTSSTRSLLPRLKGPPSDDRPAWLRDLPAQLERHPVPQGWGGDHLAALQSRSGAKLLLERRSAFSDATSSYRAPELGWG